MYKPLHVSRLYQQLVKHIISNIKEGKLSLGDKLPPERELADQFGVSRTVVREAVKALHEKGLVRIYPGKGTFITDDTSKGMRDSIGLIVRIDQDQGLADLIQVRAILEPEIAAIAAIKATSENFLEMKQAIEEMDAAIDDADDFVDADQRFHQSLAKATQNELILRLIDPIVELLREQRKRIFDAGTGAPQRGQQHHKRIFDAIVSGDSEASRQAMIDHLEQVRCDSNIGSD